MYYCIYKCRLCKEKFKNQATSTGDVAFNAVMRTALELKQNDPMRPCMTEPHLCKDGSFGVADFMGIKNIKEEDC